MEILRGALKTGAMVRWYAMRRKAPMNHCSFTTPTIPSWMNDPFDAQYILSNCEALVRVQPEVWDLAIKTLVDAGLPVELSDVYRVARLEGDLEEVFFGLSAGTNRTDLLFAVLNQRLDDQAMNSLMDHIVTFRENQQGVDEAA